MVGAGAGTEQCPCPVVIVSVTCMGLGHSLFLTSVRLGARGEPLHRSPCFPMGLTPCVFQGFFGFVVGLCRALPLRLGAKAWKFALLALTETLASVLFPRVSFELVAFSDGTVWKVLGAH